MPRIVKEEEHTARRNEILDATQRLVYTKGYEQMSIQDILDSLQISKGAFYHYFGSKQALLEALVERLLHEAEKFLTPIVEDPNLSALEKFERYFATVARWKTAQKDFLLALLRVWYTDDNAIVRQKVVAMGLKYITPFLATIIRQGTQEGVLSTSSPDQVCEVIFSMMMGMADTVAGILLSDELGPDTLPQLENVVTVYTDALERVLGAPSGSLQLVDTATLKEWIVSPQANSGQPKVKVQSSSGAELEETLA
jgi:AcrR family transcriptional regulator